MIYLLLIAAIIVAITFGIRFYSLKKSIDAANTELKEITESLEENRIIKLAEPNKELEEMLITINGTLRVIREKVIICERREKELKKEIENISHDLRTPLTSVLGYLQIIDSERLSEEDRESLETVKRKAYSLQRLISQFYDLSRLNGGDYMLQTEDVDIARILRESVMNHYKFLAERGLDILVMIPDKPVIVSADMNAAERIFSNLLHNAAKYARTALKIRLKADKNRLLVIFENDTEGIEEDATKLFDRFYTSDSAGSPENTVLGLTISRHLAENMGGKISVELETKEDDQWLKFIFEINCNTNCE